ncbi:MAG: GlxA family transcriptional regulator [Pseudomonadota bacterium]|nr:GlxA family transcriptional regulator [Pseudomonadota bacterium]
MNPRTTPAPRAPAGQPDPGPAAAPGASATVSFLLLDRFSLLAFSSAIEPLRLANHVSGRELFSWKLLSETGAPVAASCGMRAAVDGGLEELPRGSRLVVCSGLDVARATSRPVLNWLRRESRRGVAMSAVCTGAFALARAGLLDGRRCTIHWENQDGFAEDFPDVELTDQIYVVDGDAMTAAGGAAAGDMMLRLVAQAHGPDIAGMVADQMVYTNLRGDEDHQRLSVPARIGVRHPKLSRVIDLMNAHIEEPVSAARLAEEVGMSTRQLERLFRRYLDRSPKRYYLELRLEKARRLLLQTDMSVIYVALACGFTSPSHFSKCYRAHYKRTPYRERGVAAPGPAVQQAEARAAMLVSGGTAALDEDYDEANDDLAGDGFGGDDGDDGDGFGA